MKSIKEDKEDHREKLYVDPNIAIASTIPASFYTSEAWFEQSKEKIFARTWQFCLSSAQLKTPGQIIPHTLLPGLLDESILFVRHPDDSIKCLSNVCTHRGNILIEGPCLADKIKCRYHGRTFNLAGAFQQMPAFETAENFPTKSDDLPHVPFEHLGDFIFAAITPAMPFADCVDDIRKRLFWLPFNEMRFDPDRSRDYLVKGHWALYCENYLEGLHIPFIHKSLRSTLDFQNYTTELYRYTNLQLALGNDGEEVFNLPKSSVDYGKSVSAYYYWLFPNTMLNFYPWGCSVNIVKPMGIALTKVTFLTFILDETKLNRGAGGDLDRVEREDEAVVESVQLGIRSRFYDTGRYSPTMETGTHHFHQLLCEFLNRA